MAKKFYITTPIFYPNAKLHVGHAYTTVLADILARYHRLIGDETYFLTGSDENTGKILKNINGSTAEYLDNLAENFKDLYKKLDISYDQFIRTSDKEKHWPGAKLMWQKLVEAGDIYKSKYSGLYCLECETFYTEKDLIEGKCPVHAIALQKIEEENYFFRLSKYTGAIKRKIESDELKIIPTTRKNEIMALLERGLEDVSFSRPIKNVPHGISVPNDPEQVIYVWCDALVNYVSALGFGTSPQPLSEGKGLKTLPFGEGREGLLKFWPADVHVIGKDILRFHAAIWPAMLLSANLPLPKKLLVHGFITSGGKKMSKSLGNVIDPQDLIAEYGTDAVRYYLARHISPFEDGDLTLESFKETYNAHLANGLGNLISRIMKMAEDNLKEPVGITQFRHDSLFIKNMESYNIQRATELIWLWIGELDAIIQKQE
ncbi:MAG: class I tRNA ligase family protein [Patescibacteria group bacterium]